MDFLTTQSDTTKELYEDVLQEFLCVSSKVMQMAGPSEHILLPASHYLFMVSK